ncbi:MAG: outer membrane lipoprotein chaperone LolA [Bacteroidota bacterium]|nr:outer membrane lipoprotein chaperone LolA [Bacteroidota bacterium]
MKYLKNYLFLLFIFCTTEAQTKYSAAEVVEKVQQKYAQMNDASASFTKKTSLRYGKNVQVQSGTVKIKKGNKYRIALPQQLLVTDGKTVWLYSSENNQVLIDVFKEQKQNFSPDKFLTGFPKDFTPKKIEENGDTIIVRLIPSAENSPTAFITSLTMWIQPEKWLVKKIEYTDRNHSNVTITLSDVVFNQGIKDSEFHFESSAEIRIIDMRKLK